MKDKKVRIDRQFRNNTTPYKEAAYDKMPDKEESECLMIVIWRKYLKE